MNAEVCEFEVGATRYRVIKKDQAMVIEVREFDAMGEPSWRKVLEMSSTGSILFGA